MTEVQAPELLRPNPRIEVVYAGGTISSLATPEGYREGGHVVDLLGQLAEKSPQLKGRFTLGNAEVAYTGLSENMDENYWRQIESIVSGALQRSPDAVLITHGTDSMEQTARRLEGTYGEELVKNNRKIILTGANEDISHPETDAWSNLEFSFESASGNEPPGVYVSFHGRLIPAGLVVKEPYNGQEMNYVAKNDVQYVEAVSKQKEMDELVAKQFEEVISGDPHPERVVSLDVNVVRGNNDELFEKLTDPNVKTVLLTLYHSGTANIENPLLSIPDFVKKLREERDIIFFGVTENGEPVDLHSYETSVRLREAGVVPLYDMRKDVALKKLERVTGEDSAEVIDEMLKNRVGEIDESRIIPEDMAKLKLLYAA